MIADKKNFKTYTFYLTNPDLFFNIWHFYQFQYIKRYRLNIWQYHHKNYKRRQLRLSPYTPVLCGCPKRGKIYIAKIFFGEKRQQNLSVYPGFCSFFCFCWNAAKLKQWFEPFKYRFRLPAQTVTRKDFPAGISDGRDVITNIQLWVNTVSLLSFICFLLSSFLMREFSTAISAFVFLQAHILNGTSFFSLFLIYMFNSRALSSAVHSQSVKTSFLPLAS